MARTVVKNLDGARMLRETGWSGFVAEEGTCSFGHRTEVGAA